ncbi:hypothetical protein [Salinivibrio proteolyticus]|uniref:hypothetical protein n=1 Tax=Salinivibrio proteolyticus TaxID=334715 RepID=UPI001054727D|nr:hypothetical protein [Salinivibrio proteolyticus]
MKWNDELVDTLPPQTRSAINCMWNNMHHRCLSKPQYKDVEVCEEWSSFPTFCKWVVCESNWEYDKRNELCLSRLGDKGDYSPENCTFYTKQDSAREAHQNIYLLYYSGARNLNESREVFFGLSEIAELTGVSASTLSNYTDTDKYVNSGRTQPFKLYKLS